MKSKSIPILLLGMALAATPLHAQGRRNSRPQEDRAQAPDDEQARNPNRRVYGPGPHAGDWLRRYQNFPVDQQERMLQSDSTFQRLAPQRQQELVNRLQWFNRLAPEQQQRILQRMETWEHLTRDQQQQSKS